MKNLLIVFVLGLFAMATAPTQSMANVADKQQHAVVITSQAVDASAIVALSVPEVAASPGQITENTRLFASLTPDKILLAQNDVSASSPTDDQSAVTSTDLPTNDAIDPPVTSNTGSTSKFIDILKSNWAELLLGLLAFIKILVRLTPSIKDDAVFGKIDNFISWIVPNLQKK